MSARSGPPTLPAYRDGKLLLVWCEHEHLWHQHGGCTWQCDAPKWSRICHCPPGTGDGHRVAHCVCQSSPYVEGGYYLEEVGPMTPAVKRAHPRPHRGPIWSSGGDSVAHGCPTCDPRKRAKR